MSGNEFSGPLQDRFGEPNEFNETGLVNLIAMDLSRNSFSGAIPSSLESLEAIKVIKLQYNEFTGTVPDDICSIRGTLSLLEADCGGDPVPNECSCCTTCCDRETNTCRRQRRHLSSVNKEDLVSTKDNGRAIPGALESSDQCTVRYRWDSETGILFKVFAEFPF